MNKVHFLEAALWSDITESDFEKILDAYNEDGYRLVQVVARDQKNQKFALFFEKMK